MVKKLKKFLPETLAGLLIFVLMFSVSTIAQARDNNNDGITNKVRICHRTASFNHPYQSIRVDYHAADGIAGNQGNKADHAIQHDDPLFDPETMQQGDKWGDIISPHHEFAGLNWSKDGQEIWENGCRVEEETPEPSPSSSITPTPTPTPTETVTPTPSPSTGGGSSGKVKTKISPQVLGTTAPTPQVAAAQESLPISGADIDYTWVYYFVLIGVMLLASYLKEVGWGKLTNI